MLNVLTLVAAADAERLPAETVQAARDALAGAGGDVLQVNQLGDKAVDLVFDKAEDVPRAPLDAVLNPLACDWAAQPMEGRQKRLLLADMDSTMIKGESLDEVAALTGLGEQIADITTRAMRGELDFGDALKERLSLLRGQPVGLFNQVAENLEPMPGAGTLVATMQANNGYCALVSGGLGPLVGLIAENLGFHEAHCNDLDIKDERLTGDVVEPVFGAEGKRQKLHEIAKRLGLPMHETLAIGDGANDIPMLREAGMGIAYYGKPAVVAEAAFQVKFGTLETVLYFQGYRKAEFVAPNWG